MDSRDRRGLIGRRDYTIVMLLCRLGLRGGEVVSLTRDDIDWRAGKIVVTGKGGGRDRLPLAADVGAALVDYLRQDRPKVKSRAVFMRQVTPISWPDRHRRHPPRARPGLPPSGDHFCEPTPTSSHADQRNAGWATASQLRRLRPGGRRLSMFASI